MRIVISLTLMALGIMYLRAPAPAPVTPPATKITIPVECPAKAKGKQAYWDCEIEQAKQNCADQKLTHLCNRVAEYTEMAKTDMAWEETNKTRAAAVAATWTYSVKEYPHIWSWGVIRYTSHPASFERSAIVGMYKTKGEAEDAANALRSK